MALPRENRLPLRSELDRINREGKTYHSTNLTLVHAHSHFAVPRFGIIISKKVAKLAVARNGIRRQLTSAIFRLLSDFSSADYLLLPRSSIQDLSHLALISELSLLAVKIKDSSRKQASPII